MDIKTWKSVEKEVNLILSIMESDPSFVVCEDAEDLDNDDKEVVPEAGQVVKLRGSIIGYIERLDDEFIKSLQATDPHTPDYIDRLRDEPSLYALLVRSQVYFEKNALKESISRVIVRRLDHLYYKVSRYGHVKVECSSDLLPPILCYSLSKSSDLSKRWQKTCFLLVSSPKSLLLMIHLT